MITLITLIKAQEQSPAVANLQAGLKAMGLQVDPTELTQQRAGASTTSLVQQFQKQMNITPQPGYLVDEATAAALNKALADRGLLPADPNQTCLVRGFVTDATGQVARGLTVAAFDQDMRSRQELGRTTTDATGEYRIYYGPAKFGKAEIGTTDLVVEVYAANGEVLATTDVKFNAPLAASIDISLTQLGSEAEYDRIVRILTPLLDGQGVTLDTLDENDKNQDLTFAAGETGFAQDELTSFAVARRMPAQTKLPAPFWFAVLATKTIFPDRPSDNAAGIADLAGNVFSKIPTTPVAAIEAGLQEAIARMLIANPADQLPLWLKAYGALMTQEAQKPGSTSNVAAILNASGIAANKQDALLQIYLQGGSRSEILQNVIDSKQFTAPETAGIEATLIVNDLTLGDVKLLGLLKRGVSDASGAPALARMSAQDWSAAITKAGSTPPDFVAGSTPAEKLSNYATLLTKRAALAYPTAAFAGDLARAIDSPTKPALKFGAEILSFINAHPDFELATTSIDGYMRHEAESASFPTANQADVVAELKASQRVFKVASNFTATNTLLANGLHSAQKIYRMGQTQFVKTYANQPGFTPAFAAATFQRAANTHAAVVTMVGELRATMNANQINGLANNVPALGNSPDLANLFGSLDTCACDHCQSIFSPAAYLADLLTYLEARNVAPPQSAKDIFFSRRPDIGTLELSCANSNTPLLYIDLACEILEDQVAPWILFTLPAALSNHLMEGLADNTLISAFQSATPSVTLSSAARVSAQDQYGSWVIHDTAATYRVRPLGMVLLQVSILRQTHLTAEELSAYPEYVNDAAYGVLSNSKYPLALPFDLFTEEARAYLQSAGLRRSDVMETLLPNTPGNALDIAAEYVGIARGEQSLILQADAAHQYIYWGEADNTAAMASMSKVDVFLKRTGIQYADLQRMLTLPFVNPGGAIAIVNADSSCDLATKTLAPLDQNALDRIHRFLRLWAKLGWKMWELDLVIQTLGNGNLDGNLILKLYPFLQIKEKLQTLTIEQLCAFYGSINTNDKFTVAFQPFDPSLYKSLFLNKKLTKPLAPYFAISAVTAATTETIPNHILPVLAATRVKQTDLQVLLNLPALTNQFLSLANLTFLYRHALLARMQRVKIADWPTLLSLFSSPDVFQDPARTLAFLKWMDRIQAGGFSLDQLDYILNCNLSAKSAPPEKAITPILTTLQKSLQTIAAANDPANIPSSVSGLTNAISSQLQTLGWDAASIGNVVDTLSSRVLSTFPFTPPAGFTFPTTITTDPIMQLNGQSQVDFNAATNSIRFTGIMTDAQKVMLSAVSVDASYQACIQLLYDTPRLSLELSLKFYLPRFIAPLTTLPAAVSFASLPQTLAAKIQYDPSQKELSFLGIMTTAEQNALLPLSADSDYITAVNSLFNQPRSGVFPTSELWWSTPVQSAFGSSTVAGLAAAEAVLADYVARKQETDQIIQQLSTALGLTQVVAKNLLTNFPIFGTSPHPLLFYFLDSVFITGSVAITSASFPEIFQGYYWLHRVALIIKTLAITYSDLGWIVADQAATGVIDFTKLPLSHSAPPATLLPLLDLCDFMRLHHTYSQDDLSVLDIVDHLINPPIAGYTNTQVADDVATLTGCASSDVATLIAPNTINAAFPADYKTVGGWLLLAKVFSLIGTLNCAASSALAIANPDPALGPANSASLKQLLHSKYDDATWLGISKPIQDSLRQRKRDSLVAYLLVQPKPADAPTGKWDDPDDLFAYYLIDVEMCSCQPTSRIVQASAAVQFFVQRAFMGLEPKVRVSVEDDSGWSEWSWMKYYRLWEANREVFAYPENYYDPELRKDKSELFQNLQNELQQGQATADNVETAFLHYVDGLDNIAQLEIAGQFYQESNHTLHVFGRTAGANPRIYYYRRFIDGRQWTAWEKVDCDIKADFLAPLVANERLYLVWPEYSSAPETKPSATIPSQSSSPVPLDSPQKLWNINLAITEYQSGKWKPKKLSHDSVQLGPMTDADWHEDDFGVLPIDLTSHSDGPFLLLLYQTPQSRGASGRTWPFELIGCRGYPELASNSIQLSPTLTRFWDADLQDMKNVQFGGNDRFRNTLKPVLYTNATLTQEILDTTPSAFKVSYPGYMSFWDHVLLENQASTKGGTPITLGSFSDWFYADTWRTFFVRQELVPPRHPAMFYEDFETFAQGLLSSTALVRFLTWLLNEHYSLRLLFNTFYHPLTCLFAKQLYQYGVEGLMARETQFADKGLNFKTTYSPTAVVDTNYPKEIVDFSLDASYALYNWELFFHAPLMVAQHLSQNQQFEDAMRWFHFIFDPTGGHDKDPTDPTTSAPAPQKYWITKPFFQLQSADYLQQRIGNLMNLLASDPANLDPSSVLLQRQLQNQVQAWREDPFDPNLIAQYRINAYQLATVRMYLDNLIAWGDQRFRMDTLESVNEATQLYVVAAEILGPRPGVVPPAAKPLPQTFNELDVSLDAFSNALVSAENLIPPMTPNGPGDSTSSIPSLLYFCIPQNDQLLQYWNTVEDRLYKIRHCLNIAGVFNPPALFAPPLDVMGLVRASAGGEDLSSVLSDLDAPIPYYRFTTMLAKANEFDNDVKALGGALLSALEKKDSEAMALLRQGQEVALLQAVRDVKLKQIEDAQLVINGLQKSREMAAIRRDYYTGLSQELMNTGETIAIALSSTSALIEASVAIGYAISGGLKAVPDFEIGAAGFGGVPYATLKTGGTNFGNSAEDAVRTLSSIAAALDKGASIASVLAGYHRRMDDWKFQLSLANKELEQLDQQIASAQKKLDIANSDLANHDLQIANSKAVNEFMTSKYTNEDLYNWMIGQVSQTYFQAYQLAFDLAKRAERCYRYEIGVEDSSYIQFGHWDSLHKGLLAGELLQLDLRRLESAYLDQNAREFECTKHISLAMLNPGQLVALRNKGICTFTLPEELFDLDYTGHYFRRIKSVSLSIPGVAGPYTTVSATLRLLKGTVRINSKLDGTSSGGPYPRNEDATGLPSDDARFRDNHVRINAIATSSAQNDSGMFELSFRDERYLPFEGAGAISTWQLELTQASELRQFSYDTISDVILHMHYTSREDTGAFRDAAVTHLKGVVTTASTQFPLMRLFDLMHEFPTEWYQFLHPSSGTLQLNIRKQHFPLLAQNGTIRIEGFWLYVRTSSSNKTPAASVQIPDRTTQTTLAAQVPTFSGPDNFFTAGVQLATPQPTLDETRPWILGLSRVNNAGNFADGDILDCYMAVQYTLH